MFFGKRRRKKSEESELPPPPEDLDDDFGFESSMVDEGPAKRPPASTPPPASHRPPARRDDDPTDVPRRPSEDRLLVDPKPGGGGPGRDLHDATIVDGPKPTSPSPGPSDTPVPPALGGEDEIAPDVTRFISRPVAPTVETVAWLVVAGGPNRGRDYRLGEIGLTVGTAPECDLRLSGDDYVSTHHAELTAERGVYTLKDLGSTNGTFRNDERVTETRVEDDDRIRFGLSDFVFKIARL